MVTETAKRRRPHEADLNEFIVNKRVLSDHLNLLKISDHDNTDMFCDTVFENNTQKQFGVTNGHISLSKKYHNGIQPNTTLQTTGTDTGSSDDSKDNNFVNPFEYLIGAKSKYVRKVDYLIDEVIRKTRRKFGQNNASTCFVPSNIGPQPTTDHALSVYHENLLQKSNIPPRNSTIAKDAFEGQLSVGNVYCNYCSHIIQYTLI